MSARYNTCRSIRILALPGEIHHTQSRWNNNRLDKCNKLEEKNPTNHNRRRISALFWVCRLRRYERLGDWLILETSWHLLCHHCCCPGRNNLQNIVPTHHRLRHINKISNEHRTYRKRDSTPRIIPRSRERRRIFCPRHCYNLRRNQHGRPRRRTSLSSIRSE